MKRAATNRNPATPGNPGELRRRAETRLNGRRNGGRSKAGGRKSEIETARVLHELQVHQVELEMQNAELLEARDRMEALAEKYTDLYDFAPVGYFSLDEQGRILEVNLTGAALLGVGRSRLVNRRLPPFVALPGRPVFLAFLEKIFTRPGKQVCEATLVRENGSPFFAAFHATSALSAGSPRKWCRVAVSDITALRQAQEAQQRLEALAIVNRDLKQEIVRRQAVEESLRQSERHQRELLEQSHWFQEQLRHLSRQVLHAQEEERKRISRELHDVIAQTLTGINIRLATLKKEAGLNPRDFERSIATTQKLVEKSVNLVHEFARELRPTVLDDLGLIPALHAFMRHFAARTGLRTHLTAFAGVEELDTARRTVLFRVAQEALTNVARHAKAGRADVTIQKRQGAACMEIKDDGRSFHVELALRGKGSKRLGLLGMRERVEMVGGTFCIESAPGHGTTIRVEVPFTRARGRNPETPH